MRNQIIPYPPNLGQKKKQQQTNNFGNAAGLIHYSWTLTYLCFYNCLYAAETVDFVTVRISLTLPVEQVHVYPGVYHREEHEFLV